MRLFNRTLYLGSDVAAIDLDFDRSPAEIDLLVVRGPNKWRFIPGVFTLREHVLRICLDLSSTARPVTLRPPPGSRHLFVTYERAPCQGTRAVSSDTSR